MTAGRRVYGRDCERFRPDWSATEVIRSTPPEPVLCRRQSSSIPRTLRLPTLGDQSARLAEEAVKEKSNGTSVVWRRCWKRKSRNTDHQAVAQRMPGSALPGGGSAGGVRLPGGPHISVAVMGNLSKGGYLTRKEPVIFLAETGTGKTHLNRVGRWPPAAARAGASL